ncbi:leucine-rich repeat domain-containing protein [Azospirillum sp. B4]|uniref:leucine-rich repeat domain-containing protein n=1 Tax=Azospirillum sp. B4 TaxID=95605 RepID=UPI0003463005|nr:leucine-rich repeat domain-containing protein [Azospirillum sp. B4]
MRDIDKQLSADRISHDLAVARQRIAEEAVARTGCLDLCNLHLPVFPTELFALTHLTVLLLGRAVESDGVSLNKGRYSRELFQVGDITALAPLTALEIVSVADTTVTDLGPFSACCHLRTLSCASTGVTDLSPLSGLLDLETLDCSGTGVTDLSPLSGLLALETLDCSRTGVTDLSPLSGLLTLKTLNCSFTGATGLSSLAGLLAPAKLRYSGTGVTDLSPLSGLLTLKTLNCSFTGATDLSPLSGLLALETLNCSDTGVTDLSPLSGLLALETLDCSGTGVTDLSPLSGLLALETLDCSPTGVTDLSPLSGLLALKRLNCSFTGATDLSPLSGLLALETLRCSGTGVTDLSPLSGLLALETLDCSPTGVTDLSPLSGLLALKTLNCSFTGATDLSPLSGLLALETLRCSGTGVTDLSPLSGLLALETLDCSRTGVTDLSPLSGLLALETLDCSRTGVTDLTPLAGLLALETLRCSHTGVTDLSPLSGLRALKTLDCSHTMVEDLSPLTAISSLQTLDCWENILSGIPHHFLEDTCNIRVILQNSRIMGVPAGVIPQNYVNALPALKAHFDDLRAGPQALSDVKVMVLGNGRCGKTQLCRYLQGLPFNEHWDSTHGIRVAMATMDGPEKSAVRLYLWDFGGQELYHGTHALFLRTDALFLVLWVPDQQAVTDPHGLRFRTHPPQYWVDYVRHTSGASGPLLLVQSQCDEEGVAVPRAPVATETLQAFPFHRELRFSARTRHGDDELTLALRRAVAFMRKRDGDLLIGANRLAVQRRIENFRGADGDFPPEWRWITREQFLDWCAEAGGVADPDQVLAYLHNTGLLFHRPDLFQNHIILDHAWILNGIYAVFDRASSYEILRKEGGRFTRQRLEDRVWRAAGFTVADQRLFLGMMRACGLCFVHHTDNQHSPENSDATVYIAPELLPERPALEGDLAIYWGGGPAAVTVTWRYPLLHPGVIRGVISWIGEQANARALYWRQGVCVYEQTTRARALVEVGETQDMAGEVRIAVKDGDAAALLDRLKQAVERVNDTLGLRPTVEATEPPRRVDAPLGDAAAQPPPLDFVADPNFDCFVSYAWGDDSVEGRARREIVDQLCAAAETVGVRVLRDINQIRQGDSIRAFMSRLGAGRRVFVILSDKYLHSPACTFELYEIWRHSGHDLAQFRERVRLYVLPCAERIRGRDGLEGRVGYHDHWRDWIDRRRPTYERVGFHKFPLDEIDDFKKACEFSDKLLTILYAFADTLTANSWQDFIDYGLEEMKTSSRARH